MESLTRGCWDHLWGKSPGGARLFFWPCQTQRGESCEHQLLPSPPQVSSYLLTLTHLDAGEGRFWQ